MLLKAFCLAIKIVVATMTHSEKIAEETQTFIEEITKKILKKLGNGSENTANQIRLSLLENAEISKTLPPDARKNITEFLQKKNVPLSIIAVYVFDAEEEILKSSEIVKRAVERYGKKPSSVLPSDYANAKYSPIPTLEKVIRGHYRLSPEGKTVWETRNL